MPSLSVKIKKLLLFSAGFTALIGAIGLSLESYLKFHGMSLCKTSACDIVGQYLLI